MDQRFSFFIVGPTADRILRLARHWHHQDPENFLGDFQLELWRRFLKLGYFDLSPRNVLRRASYRLCDQWRRDQRHPKQVPTDDLSELPDSRSALEPVFEPDFEKLLPTLTSKQRDICLRRILYDESYSAIAAALGTTEKCVRSGWSKVLAKLRRCDQEGR